MYNLHYYLLWIKAPARIINVNVSGYSMLHNIPSNTFSCTNYECWVSVTQLICNYFYLKQLNRKRVNKHKWKSTQKKNKCTNKAHSLYLCMLCVWVRNFQDFYILFHGNNPVLILFLPSHFQALILYHGDISRVNLDGVQHNPSQHCKDAVVR